MENKGFYNKFESLPTEAQKQVIALIDLLKIKYRSENSRSLKSKSIANKKFIGIWKDRTELKDSTKWVRNLRQSEWEVSSE
jgi:hypothetical protein